MEMNFVYIYKCKLKLNMITVDCMCVCVCVSLLCIYELVYHARVMLAWVNVFMMVFVFLMLMILQLLQLFSICCFSSESEEEAPPPKKEYHFKNKKEAIEAFKTLLKEKVQSLFGLAVIVVGAQLNPLGVTQYV